MNINLDSLVDKLYNKSKNKKSQKKPRGVSPDNAPTNNTTTPPALKPIPLIGHQRVTRSIRDIILEQMCIWAETTVVSLARRLRLQGVKLIPLMRLISTDMPDKDDIVKIEDNRVNVQEANEVTPPSQQKLIRIIKLIVDSQESDKIDIEDIEDKINQALSLKLPTISRSSDLIDLMVWHFKNVVRMAHVAYSCNIAKHEIINILIQHTNVTTRIKEEIQQNNNTVLVLESLLRNSVNDLNTMFYLQFLLDVVKICSF